jgi:hypothetical protein
MRGFRAHSGVIVYIKDNGFITNLLPYNFATLSKFAINVVFKIPAGFPGLVLHRWSI